jgi:hypothetical protein
VEEELAVPLRRLRREAGDPTYERIAEDSGLCRNTVDNAFNARRLVRWRTVEAIVVALGGDAGRWRERWVAARGRLDAIKAPVAVPYVPEPVVSEPVVVRRRRGRLPAVLVGAVTVLGWGMAVAVLAFGSMDGEASAARDRTGSVPIAQVRPVAGNPVYAQCSDRDRSVLSEPGRVRGGVPRGKLRPGDRFVVTSKTAYWRYGRVPGDPERQGWVLAGYLCRTGG